jgi:hypothetical protein
MSSNWQVITDIPNNNYHGKYIPVRKYCALWSFPPLNAAEQKATPPLVTTGQRAAADGQRF